MLLLNELYGDDLMSLLLAAAGARPASGAVAPTVAYINSYDDPDTLSSYVFSGCDIGVAGSDRIVVLTFSATGENDFVTISSITSPAGTVTIVQDAVQNFTNVCIAYIVIPTGTTADFTVNCSAAKQRATLSIHTIHGVSDPTPVWSEQAIDGLEDALSLPMIGPENTVAIYGVAQQGAASAVTWSDVTETYDQLIGNEETQCSGGYLVDAGVPHTETATFTTTSPMCLVGVVFGAPYDPPSFSPYEIEGLIAWYDANDADTFTYSSGTTVSGWDSKIGSYHLTQPVDADRPERQSGIQNGLPAVFFDVNHFIEHTGVFQSPWPCTIFCAHEVLGGTTNANASIFSWDTGVADYQIRQLSSGTFRYQFSGAIANLEFDLADVGDDVPRIYSLRGEVDDTKQNLGGAGAETSVTSIIAHTSGNEFRLNVNRSGSLSPSAYHYEFLIWDRVLTVSEMNEVGNYLADKWDLTWTDLT
jgi:hypothetical protein